jgi:zinc transporter ZupT
MLAASYWSLLAPAIDMAAESPLYGEQFAFIPVAIGFFLGAAFVYASDVFMSHAGVDSPVNLLLKSGPKNRHNETFKEHSDEENNSPSTTVLLNGKLNRLRQADLR